jgi:hypothetical protein
MATRTAQIIIEIDDKSLIDLNAEIKTLETSIKNIKIGTAEWVVQNEKLGRLKQQFLTATNEAKKLQSVVQKVSGAQQLQAIARLGQGMVGAFAGVTTAIGLLGGSTEKLDEVAKKAQGFLAIMYSLQSISRTFSKTNLAGLASIGQGFKGLVVAVKGFSTAAKAALISTGIGALVVGLGLVIANWDKIKNAITGASNVEKKAFEKSQAQGKIIIEGIDAQNKALEEQINLLQLRDSFYSPEMLSDNTELIIQNINNQNKALAIQIELKRKQIALAQSEVDKLKQKINVEELEFKIQSNLRGEVEATNKIGAVGGAAGIGIKIGADIQKNRVTEKEKEYLIQKNIIEAGKIEIKNLEEQLKLNKEIISVRTLVTEELKDETKRGNDRINSLNNEVTILKVKKDTENKIYNKELESLDIQIKQLEDFQAAGAKLNDEEFKRLGTLYAERDALIYQNKLYNYQVKVSKEKYEEELKYLKLQHDLNITIANLQIKYIDINEENKKKSDYFGNVVSTIENELELITDEQKRYELILKNNKEINEIRKITNTEIINGLNTELSYYTEIQTKDIEKLQYEKLILETQIKSNESRKLQSEETAELFRNNLAENEKLISETESKLSKIRTNSFLSIAEKQSQTLEYQNKINELEEKSKSITVDILNTNNEITDATNEIDKTKIKIENTDNKIYNIDQNILIETEKTTKEIEKQEKVYKKLQDLIGQYSEEIDVSAKIISQTLAFVSTLFDSNAQRHQEQIDALNSQYEIMNQKEADRLSRLVDLEEELKDANGDRYDELLRLIDAEKSAKDRNYISEVEQKNNIAKLEHKRLEDERKAAIWRKAQAIIDATIQAALAVVKSLPNVFLSVAVGILGAAQVATIAAQKIPAVPPLQQFKKGGYTQKALSDDIPIKAILHSNEYVVPAKVVRSPQAQYHIESLEKQRLSGYQSGGLVVPANMNNINTTMDYEKLAVSLADAISKLPPSQVSLVEISNGLKDVQMTKSFAGLTR